MLLEDHFKIEQEQYFVAGYDQWGHFKVAILGLFDVVNSNADGTIAAAKLRRSYSILDFNEKNGF